MNAFSQSFSIILSIPAVTWDYPGPNIENGTLKFKLSWSMNYDVNNNELDHDQDEHWTFDTVY